MSTLTVVHDPDAVLDYAVDWAQHWLPEGDTVTSHDVAVEAGDVVVDSDSETDGVVTAWVSGGTNGTRARVRYRVSTAEGRTDDRSIHLNIVNR